MAVASRRVTIASTTTAVRLDSAPATGPGSSGMAVNPSGSGIVVYVGGPGVSAANGFAVNPGDPAVCWQVNAGEQVYGLLATAGSVTLPVLEQGV